MLFNVIVFFLINRFGRKSVTHPGGPVVSLTTFGKRSKKVYYAIESIARGDVRPSRLILWIDEEALLKSLPATIRRLQTRGLEVKPCKNYGPHKKYYPYVESQDSFTAPLITGDDDMMYPKSWASMLIDAYDYHPEVVSCFAAHVIEINSTRIAKFKNMMYCRSIYPSFYNLAIGAAGVIYPPLFLRVLKRAGTEFMTCCPKGDDLWLHVQALRTGFKVRQILPRLPYYSFQNIPGTQGIALCHDNVDSGDGYETQGRATYCESDIQLLQTE
jgi:hypothetical protein